MLPFCDAQRDWMVHEIERLVRAESPSTDKEAVDRCGAVLAAQLEGVGMRVERLYQRNAGDHIRAETGSGPRSVLLLGHFDTVWPVGRLQTMPLRLEGERLYGPGVFDMKAGIVIAMAAVRALQNAGAARDAHIVMLWTTDEEIGSASSRALIEEEARHSEAVLVLEPSLPGGALKTARKGCAGYEVVVRGIAAHAGIEPEKGASAVEELARQIPRINGFQDRDRGLLVNVVQAWGGARSNIIPDEAHALVDVRVPDLQTWEEVNGAFAGLKPVNPRTTIECRGWFDRPPLERRPSTVRLYDQARAVAAGFGRELREGSTGGGSDGNFTAALGVPTLDGLGAVGDGAHAAHEHVLIPELSWRAAVVAGLVR
ncbi:MAG: M20 family metallopeptidase [Acidobacteriota bacterium]